MALKKARVSQHTSKSFLNTMEDIQYNQLWIEMGQSEKCNHMTGIVVKSVLRAYSKITTRVQERKRTPSFYTIAAFLFVCRSIPKLLDEKTTGLCQLSETCHHYSFAQSGLPKRGCPMAVSLLFAVFLDLQDRGGCSL